MRDINRINMNSRLSGVMYALITAAAVLTMIFIANSAQFILDDTGTNTVGMLQIGITGTLYSMMAWTVIIAVVASIALATSLNYSRVLIAIAVGCLLTGALVGSMLPDVMSAAWPMLGFSALAGLGFKDTLSQIGIYRRQSVPDSPPTVASADHETSERRQ